MPTHTSVFKASADVAANGDAWGRVGSVDPSTPSQNFAGVGNPLKGNSKDMFFTRFDMKNPTSGPSILNNGNVFVTKAKIEYTVHTTAVIDGPIGIWRAGIMESGSWSLAHLGFGTATYPDLGDFPYPTDDSDVYQAGTLYNDTFFMNSFGNANNAYDATTHPAGMTVVAGEGYTVGTVSFPLNELLADFFVNFVSELNLYFARSAFLNPGTGQFPLGIVIDTAQNPVSGQENFFPYTSDDVTEDGLVLTIEWEDRTPAEITIESFGIDPLITAESHDVEPLMSAESIDLEPLITAESSDIDPLITSESEDIEPLITAFLPKGGEL